MKATSRGNRIDTTLGELIEAVSEFAFEYADDSREAYDLARMVLVDLLKAMRGGSEIFDRHFPTTQ